MFDLSEEGDGSDVFNLTLAVPPSNGDIRFLIGRYPPTWEDRQDLVKDLQRVATATGKRKSARTDSPEVMQEQQDEPFLYLGLLQAPQV